MAKRENYFKQDLDKFYRWKGGSSTPHVIKKIYLWIFCYELHCVAVMRFNHLCRRLYNKNKLIGLIPVIISFILFKQSEFFHHVILSPNMEVGPGFLIMHASSVYISATKIGKNFTVYNNTTIGWGVQTENNEVPEPEIGDNVWVGIGVILSGKIKIGNDVSISSGSVLSKDIPDKCLVAGNPGRIINNNYFNPIQNANNPK